LRNHEKKVDFETHVAGVRMRTPIMHFEGLRFRVGPAAGQHACLVADALGIKTMWGVAI